MTGRRRGNNEGTITKRSDGRWEARVSLEGGRRKSFYGKTRMEVQRKLAQAHSDMNRGLPIVGERQTVSQYFESWLASARYRLKATTFKRYRINLRHHILPALGHVALSRLTPQQVQALYTKKFAVGYSASTVANIHTVLHSGLKEAVRLGLVQRNVADLVQKPRRRRTKMQTLSEEQVRIFLKAIKGKRFETLYILALSTGMREGELLGLRWEDVDLERGFLQVKVSLQESDGPERRIQDEPKTPHSRRQSRSQPRRRKRCASTNNAKKTNEGLQPMCGMVASTSCSQTPLGGHSMPATYVEGNSAQSWRRPGYRRSIS